MDLIDDLHLGHSLAAANDAGIAWICLDQFDLFFTGKFTEMWPRRANGVPAAFEVQLFSGIHQ